MLTRGAVCVMVLAAAACGSTAGHPEPQSTSIRGPFVAGRTYVSDHGFVRYRSGDAPLVISVPHDGTLAPAEIPDRTSGTTVGDAGTLELATHVAAAWRARTNQTPHLVICDLRRTKVDVNRDLADAGPNHPLVQRTWVDYHAAVESALRVVQARAPLALYVDLHGHGHPEEDVELGYLLTGDELTRPDVQLVVAGTQQRSSLRALAGQGPHRLLSLLRGPASLGAGLAARGYATVPSPARPHPGTAPYFSGGYSVQRHAGPQVVAVQIEAPFDRVRQNAVHRAAFAHALAAALLEWRDKW